MVVPSFFGGDSGISYEELQRRKQIVQSLLASNSPAPKNVGEGLTEIGRAIAGRMAEKRWTEKEQERQSRSAAIMSSLFGGGGSQAGMPNGAPSGTMTQAAPTAPSMNPQYEAMKATGGPTVAASNQLNAEREILAKTIMAEAGNQSPDGMLAVGAVIANRAAAGGYGDGIKGVIMKPGQFSAWNSVTGYAGGEQGQNMDAIKASERAYAAADAVLSGQYKDPTGGALNYYNPSISNPKWGRDKAGGDWSRIGDHIFGNAGAGRAKGSRQQQPSYNGPSPQAIMRAMADPALSPQDRQILQMMYGQAQQAQKAQQDAWAKANDPMTGIQRESAELDLELQRLKLDAARNPSPEKTATITEYEYALGNGYQGTFNEFINQKEKAGAANVSTVVNTGDPIDARPMADKPAKGYQRRWDDERKTWVDELIPGGSIDREAEALEEKQALAQEQKETAANIVLDEISLARGLIEGQSALSPATGLTGSIASTLDSSRAGSLKNRLTTIKANIGFDKLQGMRDASPTGGALGQVSEFENRLLQAVFGSLEQAQKQEDVLYNLDRLEKIYGRIIHEGIPEEEARELYKDEVGSDFGASRKNEPYGDTPDFESMSAEEIEKWLAENG